MRKFFLDFEFIEGFRKRYKWLPSVPKYGFNRKTHFIELVSIGIVADNGDTYYAISNEFNANEASQWVKDNVLSKLPSEYLLPIEMGDAPVPNPLYKSLEQIKEEVLDFVYKYTGVEEGIEFYGYYSDYDWVLFCSLFGKMIDLPLKFPMFCYDLKQMADDICELIILSDQLKNDSVMSEVAFYNQKKFELERMKQNPFYPKQLGDKEHHAENDAQWNKALYYFLTGIKHAVLRDLARK